MSSTTRPLPQTSGAKPGPKPSPAEPARSRTFEERDWHASSQELAQGLVVEEMADERFSELFGNA
jgi:hypothetical protein